MSKYSTEYPKHNLYICRDGLCSYINLVLSKHGNNYLYVQFVYPKTEMYNGIKEVIELKDGDSILYNIINNVIDKSFVDLSEKDNFQYILLPEICKNKYHLYIYICCSDSYYDTFVGDISTGRSRNKLPFSDYIF